MQYITLKNKAEARLIHDVILHPLKINRDTTGVLVETLRTDWPDVYGPGREFAMQYYSVTKSGVARDEAVWHFHPTGQEDRFLVAKGEIVVAIADQREDSPTNGLLNLFHINADEDPFLLIVPKRTLHGFMVVSDEDAVLLNFPTKLYNPEEEGRIPYSQALVKMDDGLLFSWQKVRSDFLHH